jgi:hypothetical protein
MKFTTLCRISVGAVLAALTSLAALAAGPAGSPLPRLDAALAKAAPDLIGYLKDHNYKCVGVLPFLARVGDGPVRPDLGPLNRNLARRLEIALVLAMRDDSIMLVTGAGDSVLQSANTRASHRTPSSRRELFRISKKCFHPAWGNEDEAKPDVFLTGEAEFSPDFRTVKIIVRAFDDKDKSYKTEPVPVGKTILASTETRTLSEAGVSYASRGLPDEEDDDAAKDRFVQAPYIQPSLGPRQEKKEEKDDDPDKDKAFSEMQKRSRVRLEVCYNGKAQPVHRGTVPTPEEGDRVTFRLKNESTSDTYAVVLKLNGQNVLFHEDKDAYGCLKLILKPEQAITVRGFQKDDGTSEDFKVTPPEESKGLAAQYGEHAGTIQMVVFRAMTPKDEAAVKKAAERHKEMVAIARGVMPSEKTKDVRPSDLQSLQASLRAKVGPAEFKLTDKSIQALRAAKEPVPDGVLAKLKPLKDKEFAVRREFVQELGKLLDKDELARFQDRVVSQAADSGSRGMIVPGEEVDRQIQQVDFDPYPEPVVDLTTRYYEPKDGR